VNEMIVAHRSPASADQQRKAGKPILAQPNAQTNSFLSLLAHYPSRQKKSM